ncbi:hypothetical protein BOTBODRAFT_118977 [Botryobasidium botryosum FD-172 SS1]|uniref:Clp1-like protein n=1 Tax=Botryobasidium botryosum (strain FD-172 SS1) TaxID=930990 RepID=A0A067LXU3_BOTB1|nr:hypothetical protein BOTBODRAFT_118977 [Botryobasidium botryosum FD-172 SS1]
MTVFAPVQPRALPPHASSKAKAAPYTVCTPPAAPRRRSRSSLPNALACAKLAASKSNLKATVVPLRQQSHGSKFPAPTRKVHLPRHLPRPAIPLVSTEALAAIDPALQSVPLAYVHQKLDALRSHLIAGASSVSPASTAPPHGLPTEVELIVHDVPFGFTPTHMFAVMNARRSKAALYPFHHLVFAAHCANMPAIPAASTSTSAPSSSGHTVVPVVPLVLPSPETFPLIRDFIYTKRTDRLLSSLFPLPTPPSSTASHFFTPPPSPSSSGSSSPSSPATPGATTDTLSRALASTFTLQGLFERARSVHGLWANAVALGIADDELWRVMATAWEVVVNSIAISTGQPVQVQRPGPSRRESMP